MNLIYKLIIGSSLLAASISQSAAQSTAPTRVQSKPLTLEACREMALERNLTLKSSNEKVLAAEDIVAAYRANHLPNFSISGNYIYSTSSKTLSIAGGYLPTFVPDPTTGELVPNIAGLAPDGSPIFKEYAYMPDQNFDLEIGSVYNVGLQIAQPIYMGGKVRNATKLAGVGADVARLEQQLTRSEVIEQSDKAFYTFVKVQEMLRSANKYYDVVEEFYRQVSNAYDKGMCTRNDKLKVEVRLNEAKLLQMKAENGLRLSRMNLCYAIGLPLTYEKIVIRNEFNDDITIDSKSLDISSRPEVAMLEKQVEAKELETKITKSDFMPSVTALASYGYMDGFKVNSSKLISGASFGGGVMVSVPLFHWGEGRRKVSAGKREVIIAQNQLDDLSQKMTLELMQAINSYNEATYEVEHMEYAVEQAQENMRQCNNQYQAGMETIGEYLESQALWQKAMSDLVEARASQRLAYTHYLRTSGKDL